MRLTPNRRMAVFLQDKGYNDVMPINTWLETLYAGLIAKDPDRWHHRLTVHEEEVIWHKIIEDSDIGQSLLNTSGIVRGVREAWSLFIQWLLPIIAEEKQTEDSRAFSTWALQYQKTCQENAWVDSATYVNCLIEAVSAKQVELPETITLVGFEELSPQIKLLFETIQANGVKLAENSLLSRTGEIHCVALKSNQEELRAAACQAKQWLENKPGSSIGIVVPDLERQRHTVIRIFAEVLQIPFNVAAPLPLARYPLIESALLALHLLSGAVNVEKVSQFLRSPFLGESITEQIARAQLDVMMRQFRQAEFSLEALYRKFMQDFKNTIFLNEIKWLKRLQNVIDRVSTEGRPFGEFAQPKSASAWCDLFVNVLEIWGWPGERALNSEEYQIKIQWEAVLETYRGMEKILGKHSYYKALAYIEKLVKETPFSPSTPPCAIHVLGVLEATGIPFDYLWVMGMHREAWPLMAAPNPFIPFSVQRIKELPRSTAARELKMAKLFTERLGQGGSQVVFSFPLTVEEQPGFISPLLEHFPQTTAEALGIPRLLSPLEKRGEIKPFSAAFDERAPWVTEQEKVRGGTRILKLQAACPFRAFAESRLQAVPLPVPEHGLTSGDRGEIIHEILHRFWLEIKDQARLKALSVEQQNRMLDSAFDEIIKKWLAKRFFTLTPRYIALEKKRTIPLITQLLDLEKTRPFFEVVANEAENIIDFEGLQIKIRIDRIDKTENQAEILIDYKTGIHSISHWFGERPRDPQLPFYCITRGSMPVAITFAVLQPEGVKFQGLAKDSMILPRVKTLSQTQSLGSEASWEEQCAEWNSILKMLAKQFKEGIATVEPLDGENTCRTCSLKALCRIGAVRSLQDAQYV